MEEYYGGYKKIKNYGGIEKLWRVTDRIICLKMELDGVMLNVISANVPQVVCIREEKETF